MKLPSSALRAARSDVPFPSSPARVPNRGDAQVATRAQLRQERLQIGRVVAGDDVETGEPGALGGGDGPFDEGETRDTDEGLRARPSRQAASPPRSQDQTLHVSSPCFVPQPRSADSSILVSGVTREMALCAGTADEALGQLISHVVGVLPRRMLHEIGRRPVQDSALPSLER